MPRWQFPKCWIIIYLLFLHSSGLFKGPSKFSMDPRMSCMSFLLCGKGGLGWWPLTCPSIPNSWNFEKALEGVRNVENQENLELWWFLFHLSALCSFMGSLFANLHLDCFYGGVGGVILWHKATPFYYTWVLYVVLWELGIWLESGLVVIANPSEFVQPFQWLEGKDLKL